LRAWTCHNAIPFVRIRASIQAIRLLQDEGYYDKAYQLSTDTINLIPRLHNRSLSHHDQQYVVSTFSGLASSACSLALQVGELPEKALELLERGRAVILSLLIDDRSDPSALKVMYPELCATYETLLLEINTPVESITDQHQREVLFCRYI
jgi:hypothetical protein